MHRVFRIILAIALIAGSDSTQMGGCTSSENQCPGSLKWGVVSNPLTSEDVPFAMVWAGSGFLYIGGMQSSSINSNDAAWRIEQRYSQDTNSGNLASGFGSGGVIISNPTETESLSAAGQRTLWR